MRWTLKPVPSSEKVSQLAKELSLDNHLTKLLVQRGIETFDAAKAFFRPNLSGLHDPFFDARHAKSGKSD